jgi:hypothetical protein
VLSVAGVLATLSYPAAFAAERPAVHVSLVLDVSLSAERNGGFAETQLGALAFLDRLDGTRDRVGLVSFATIGTERIAAKRGFKRRVADAIGSLEISSDTNIEDGLRRGNRQLDATPNRVPSSRKMIVLFNDAPPTAFTGRFEMPSGIARSWYRGVVAAYTAGSAYRGLFRLGDGAKIKTFTDAGRPILLPNASWQPSIRPRRLPDGRSVNGTNIRLLAALQAEARAAKIRAKGYTIHVIGFMNTLSPNTGDIADAALLRQISNADGVADPSQPIGRAIIVTSASDIEAAFARLARDILNDVR